MEVLQWFPYSSLGCPDTGSTKETPPSTGLTKKQTNFVALGLTLWSIQQPWATWLDDTRGSIHCTRLPAFCWVIPCTSKIHLAGKEGSTERQSSMWMPTCEVLTIWIKTSVSGTNSTHKFFGTKSTNGSQGLLSRASPDPFATSRLCHSQSQRPQRMPRNLGVLPKPQHIRVQWPWWPGSSLVANIWKQQQNEMLEWSAC